MSVMYKMILGDL